MRPDTEQDLRADFEAQVAPYRRELLAHCYRMLGSPHDAEDLLQETLLRVGLAWHRITGEPSAYARRAMLNLFLNERRKRRRETPVAVMAESARGTGDLAADDVVARAAAISLLDRLPARQRAAVAMRYVLDLDDARIADALGCTPSTVRSQIARGLATLREHVPRPPHVAPEEDGR